MLLMNLQDLWFVFHRVFSFLHISILEKVQLLA